MTIDTAFTHFPALITERLRLRQIRPEDAEAVFAMSSDEETMRYVGRERHRDIADTHAYIQKQLARYAERTMLHWAITPKEDNQFIGGCSFHRFDEGYHRAEVGYELNRAYWGQGLVPEALSTILTYGFGELGLHRVEAIIDIENERSKKLLLKLGFQYEGNLRQRFVSHIGFEDEYYFGLLRHEWQPR